MEGHILDRIRSTGFPLEIEVSDSMESNNWVVFNNQPYLDEDESKTREIDIFAIRMTDSGHLVVPFLPAVEAVIECKKSTHAWVFFTRPEALAIKLGEDQTCDFLEAWSRGKEKLLGPMDLPNLHYVDFTRIASTYAEVELLKGSSQSGESRGKGQIFEASNQLMKYACFRAQQWNDKMSKDSSRQYVIPLYPAIVFDGRLYEAIVKADKIDLKARSHLLLKASRYSKTKRGMTHYIIDIVSRRHLCNYLRRLDHDIETLQSFFLSNEKRLRRELEAKKKSLWKRPVTQS